MTDTEAEIIAAQQRIETLMAIFTQRVAEVFARGIVFPQKKPRPAQRQSVSRPEFKRHPKRRALRK